MTKRIPGATQREVTGAQLADELEALLRRRPDLSSRRVASLAYKCHGGIKQLRTVQWPTPRLIDRVRDIIANPPSEAIKKPMGRPPSGRRKSYYVPRPRTSAQVRGDRVSAMARRAQLAKARERIAAGVAPSGAAQRIAQNAIGKLLAEQLRLQDPLEQAKITLRKRFTPVFDGTVVGKPGVFVVGSKTVRRDELMAMAEALKTA